MPKMIVLKKVHYPSGIHGKTYNPGDEIEVKTDRDAKALRILKVAKDPPGEAPAPKKQTTTAAVAAEEPAAEAEPKRRYKRSDMTPEE